MAVYMSDIEGYPKVDTVAEHWELMERRGQVVLPVRQEVTRSKLLQWPELWTDLTLPKSQHKPVTGAAVFLTFSLQRLEVRTLDTMTGGTIPQVLLFFLS